MHLVKLPSRLLVINGDPSSSTGGQSSADVSPMVDDNKASKKRDFSKLIAERMMNIGVEEIKLKNDIRSEVVYRCGQRQVFMQKQTTAKDGATCAET